MRHSQCRALGAESATAGAIELRHGYPEDFRYLMHSGMRVDRSCGRAPFLPGRRLASRTGSLEVVVADDDLSPSNSATWGGTQLFSGLA